MYTRWLGKANKEMLMSSEQTKSEQCKGTARGWWIGLVFGAGIGMTLGAAFDTVPIGLVFGAAAGSALGWLVFRLRKK